MPLCPNVYIGIPPGSNPTNPKWHSTAGANMNPAIQPPSWPWTANQTYLVKVVLTNAGPVDSPLSKLIFQVYPPNIHSGNPVAQTIRNNIVAKAYAVGTRDTPFNFAFTCSAIQAAQGACFVARFENIDMPPAGCPEQDYNLLHPLEDPLTGVRNCSYAGL